MNFWNYFINLLFTNESRIPDTYNYQALVFAAGCAVMGLLVVVLDLITYFAGQKRKSYLDLQYGTGFDAVWLIMLWGLGAGLGGFFAQSMDILTPTKAGCLFAGLGWPLILPRLLDKVAPAEEEQREEG